MASKRRRKILTLNMYKAFRNVLTLRDQLQHRKHKRVSETRIVERIEFRRTSNKSLIDFRIFYFNRPVFTQYLPQQSGYIA